jgi:SAM-dependent methyltransferase
MRSRPYLAEPESIRWWRDHLTCPSCRATLPHPTLCGTCGVKFDDDGGTPVLIDPAAQRIVSYPFASKNSTVSEAQLLTVLRLPETDQSLTDLPYHVDRAHASIITSLPKGAAILEIGCGGGQSRAWYLGRGHRYVGTDISKTRVFEWLRDHGGPDVLCDAHFLPFKEASFDVVYCAAVFEHLASPILAAQEALRVLKPGGRFLGNASFLEAWHDDSFFHFTPLGVFELLRLSGFQADAIWPGHNYSGFHAFFAMAFRFPPFRALGKLSYSFFRLENWILQGLKKLRNRPLKKQILIDGTYAGAIDWIATKPVR